MKIIVYKLLCSYIIIALFSTCGKKEDEYCTDKNTIKITQHAMDYFYFRPGSWWVYEEEHSGQQDSIWIVGVDKIYKKNPTEQKKYCRCGRGKCVEEAFTMFVNKEHNEELTNGDYLYSRKIAASISEERTFIRESGKAYFSTSSYRLEYDINGNPISPTSLGGIIEKMESVNIKGRDYKDIMHIYYTKTGVGDWLQEAWYAKNIYLVKFRKNDSTTWNLLRYHIEE